MGFNVGSRVFLDFERPNPELVEQFRNLPSSIVGDAMQRLYCTHNKLRPFNNVKLLGTAFTVKAPAGDNLLAQRAMDIAKPGDVIVIDSEDCPNRAVVGELMVDYSERKGLAGFVVEGSIRDLDAIERASIPVYATNVSPNGPYRQGPGEINVPVSIGGQVIQPGDILVGDDDGIVVVNPQVAEEILEESRELLAKEESILNDRRGEDTLIKEFERHERSFADQARAIGIKEFEYYVK